MKEERESSRVHEVLGEIVPDVIKDRENHKHLAVILQNNGKWDTHIKSIIARSRILIACLRSCKHRLSRKSLENMYIFFTLPIFDYADVVWDNCTMN